MRPSVLVLALGGLIVGQTADASVLGYIAAEQPKTAWTDADCSAIAPDPALKATCYPTEKEVPEPFRGPSGRVLLAKSGLTFFEADAATGRVDALTTDGKGTIVSVKTLIAPLASNQARGPSHLVSARIERIAAETGLISQKLAGVREVVTLTVVTFEGDGSFEEQELSYDLATLEATVTASALKSLSVGGGRDETTVISYWQ